MGRLGLEQNFDGRRRGGLKRLLMFTLMGASLTLAEKLSAQSRAGAELLEAKKNMRIVPVPEPSGYTIEFPDPAFADSVANMQNILPGFFPGAEQYPDNLRNMREVLFLAGIKSKAELEGMSPEAILDLYMANDRKGIKDALNQPDVFNRFVPLVVVNPSNNRWGWDWEAMSAAYRGGLGATGRRGGVAATGPDPEPKPEPKLPEPKPKQVAPPAPKPTSPPPVVNPPKDTGEESFLARWFGDLFGSKEKKSESAAGKGNPPEPKKPPEVKPPEKDKPPVAPPPEPPNKVPQPEKKAPSVWDSINKLKPTTMGWQAAAAEIWKAKKQGREPSPQAQKAMVDWQNYFDAVLKTIDIKGKKLSREYLEKFRTLPEEQKGIFEAIVVYIDAQPKGEKEHYSELRRWLMVMIEGMKKVK